jgi:hypothetical protein
MFIIGCDSHTRFQQIAMLDPTTGETVERRLEHETGDAEKFYASLSEPGLCGCRSYDSRTVVRENTGSLRPRIVGGRCGRDPCGQGAEPEN